MKSKLILLVLLVINTLGCTTVSQGNFTKIPAGQHKALANDSTKVLVTLYPPARTRFLILKSIKDPFGLSLIEALRQKGYSLNESSVQGVSIQGSKDAVLYYVIDEPVKRTLYRVTLRVGGKSLSRAYKLKNGTITPLGLWVRKE